MQPQQEASVKGDSGGPPWVVAIVVIGMSLFAISIGVQESNLPAEIVGGGFLAAGIGFLYQAIRAAIGQRAYGEVRLLLEHPAPAIGGRLVGTVSSPAPALVGHTLQALLTCTQWDFNGMVSKTAQPTELWRDVRQVPVQASAMGAAGHLSFALPPDRPPSQDPPEEGFLPHLKYTYYKWSLEVTAQLPRVNLERTFPVVVGPAAATVAAAPTPSPSPKPLVPTLGSVLQGAAVAQMHPGSSEADEPDEEASSTWVLVAANLVPLVGVALWGWRVQDIVFLYWMENVVIGAFNLLRMLFAQPDAGKPEQAPALAMLSAKLGLMGFFTIHYGLFCFVHGEFLANMFHQGRYATDLFTAVRDTLHESGMLLALGAIVVSRSYSFARNYLGRGEYKGMSLDKLMMQPYKRIVVTHLFIFGAGFLLMVTHAQMPALLLFVGLKIGFDVYHHRREHKALGA